MPHNPNCPACQARRFHTPEEWRLHSGEGQQGQEWQIPVSRSQDRADSEAGPVEAQPNTSQTSKPEVPGR